MESVPPPHRWLFLRRDLFFRIFWISLYRPHFCSVGQQRRLYISLPPLFLTKRKSDSDAFSENVEKSTWTFTEGGVVEIVIIVVVVVVNIIGVGLVNTWSV